MKCPNCGMEKCPTCGMEKHLPCGRDEKRVEEKERLVQTYLIVAGLLISYGQNLLAQKVAITFFLIFLFFILLYYIYLTRFHLWVSSTRFRVPGFILVNVLALMASYIFCSTVVFYSSFVIFNMTAGDITNLYFQVTCFPLTFIMWGSLAIGLGSEK